MRRLPTPLLPIEAWLCVGNGSDNALGNDNSDFAIDGRLDAAFGRSLALQPPLRRWHFPFRLRSACRAKKVPCSRAA